MRWMVGIDLRNLSGGAVAFAHWLADHGPTYDFVGAHVVEQTPHLFAAGDPVAAPETIQALAERALAPLQSDERFVELDTVGASSAEAGLRSAVEKWTADALVLGRRAPRGGGQGVRLGHVARRLLRSLPCPVVVVPPDLQTIASGPVVVATDLADDSVPAARWAATVAESVGRPLVLVHARQTPDQLEVILPVDQWEALEARNNERADAEFEGWARTHGLEGAERVVVDGAATAVLPYAAADRNACMLVVGSRRLSGLDRLLFTSSVASELASVATMAVAVVPPPAGEG